MCELLGFSGAEPTDVSGYLSAFAGHAGQNPHGWGLAVVRDNSIGVIKEPARADKSALYQLLSGAALQARVLMGHIRYATVGNIGYTNCHPFVQTDKSGREWVLFHNGTLFSGEITAPFLSRQIGETDSERILLYLLDRIDREIGKHGTLSSAEHFLILQEEIPRLSEGNNKLNLMLYDGRTLFLHTNMAGTLYQKQLEEGMLFCTVPLDMSGWDPLPMCRVLGYQDGVLRYRGSKTSEEYHYVEADEALLYRAYSEL